MIKSDLNKVCIGILLSLLTNIVFGQNFVLISPDVNDFVGVQYSSIAFADVDSDGDQDVLVTGENGSFLPITVLYTNDGMGFFNEVSGTPFEGVSRSSIAFADIDNDNDQDVLITGLNSSNLKISILYTNDGNGTFVEVESTPFDGVSDGSIAFVDSDNDDDQDVLISGQNNSFQKIAKLYINDGTGLFSELLETPFDGVTRSSVAFADIDDDNDQDVLITGLNSSNEKIAKLYTNVSAGIFFEIVGIAFVGVQHSCIAFTDIDNDSDQDVLITGLNSSIQKTSKLYTNDGNGFFSEVVDTPFDGVSHSSIAFADIDNDDDQDVLITGQASSFLPVSKLYTNDGFGLFEEVLGTPFEGVYRSSIAFADIDNDSDQDVLLTGQNSSDQPIAELYRNNFIVGIDENILFNQVSIFPNPSHGLVNIELGNLKEVSIKVFSENGQLIYHQENINASIHQFDLNIAPGIYFVELNSQGEKQQFKLVKK